jgi:nucleotide-binding universal stress UspA family protein
MKGQTMKILVAVDGSAFTQKALAYLTANRAMFGQGSDLVLVNVGTGLPANVTRHVSKDVVDGYHAEEAAKVLDPVKKYLDAQGVTGYAVQLRHGYAPEEIVAAAKDVGAGLIVMGTHGHGLFGRALMGSVATKVVAESPVSVLLVK